MTTRTFAIGKGQIKPEKGWEWKLADNNVQYVSKVKIETEEDI